MKPNKLCPTTCPLCEYKLLHREWGLLAYHVARNHAWNIPFGPLCPCGYGVGVGNYIFRSLATHLGNQRDVSEHLILAAISRVGDT